MNNEIKEILDYLSNDSKSFIICGVSYYKISDYKAKVLLDYITNLQQENDYYFKKNNELSALNTSLRSDRDDYKSRCEKAVELLQNDINFGDLCDGYKVLDILNGRSDE